MENYVYETHRMQHPLLPFIFHKSFVVTRRQSLPNWHENIELLCCTAGKGYICCGKEQYDFARGDIFVVNANMPHSICSEGSVIYCCLIIDNSFFEANGIPVTTLHFQNLIRDPEMNVRFEQAKEAFAAFPEGGICSLADVRYEVLGLCRALCVRYVTEKPRESISPANEHIKCAMRYIREHISSPITLEEIGNHLGISKYHLAREFKNFTGKTIVETINLIRCSEAKSLMEGGMSVSSAARSCGFQNLSYFTRTFKKYFQALPSEFAGKDASAEKYREPPELIGC